MIYQMILDLRVILRKRSKVKLIKKLYDPSVSIDSLSDYERLLLDEILKDKIKDGGEM